MEDDKSSAEGAGLKEWAPLHHVTLQIPAKYQNLLVTGEVRLTCVSAVDDFILLGTNTGSVYWYDSVSCTMERYRRQGQSSPASRVCAVTSADHLLAAGHVTGDVSVFVVPRLARGRDVPEYVRITEMNTKKSWQFSVSGEHKSAVTALCWSRNAARLFSGDQTGTVVVTEIDYVTESTTSRVLPWEPSAMVQLREPSAIVQLQYSRKTLLVAARHCSCVLRWPDGPPLQVGTKPRKSPADLGACFIEDDTGMWILAARSSLKVVTADLEGQVGSTIFLQPTLTTARPVELLFPTRAAAPAATTQSARLVPLWPGAVALYDRHQLLVLDVVRWEIMYRCDRLPTILDIAAAGGAIFVLCSARWLIRLSLTPDNHPAVCENLKPLNGDLSFEDILKDFTSAAPVVQARHMISSVSDQLERTGLLHRLSTKAGAVNSLRSRIGSMTTRLGSGVSRLMPLQSQTDAARATMGASVSSPDVRLPPSLEPEPEPEPAPALALSAEAVDGPPEPQLEPIARHVRIRRPGRRGRAGKATDIRSFDTVSLGSGGTPSATDMTSSAGVTSPVGVNAPRRGDRPAEHTKLAADDSRWQARCGVAAPSVVRPPSGTLDFTQFFPTDVRPSLERSDSQLSEEQREKECRLAAKLGLDDLLAPARPQTPPSLLGSSSPSRAPPRPQTPPSLLGSSPPPLLGSSSPSPATIADAPSSSPEPSYESLFTFVRPAEVEPTPAADTAPPPPADVDADTGEPLRTAATVERPPSSAEAATEQTDEHGWQMWSRQPVKSSVVTLAACARYVVVTDHDDRVFTAATKTPTPVWQQLGYTACQVSVSHDGCRVWRLDRAGVAYALADPPPERPLGVHWVPATRGVTQLSVDTASVWYIKRGGKLFVQRDLSVQRCASCEIAVDTPDKVIHVSAREGVVWAVTVKGTVLWRVGVSRAQLAGLSWEALSTGPLLVCAAFLGDGETGWLVDASGRLHCTTGVSAALPRGMDGVWRQVVGLRRSVSSPDRQVAVMSPGASLRPSVAVEGDVAWYSEPGVTSVTTNHHAITAVRWEVYTPRGRQLSWSEVHASGLCQRRGQLWAIAKGQLYGGDAQDGNLKAVPLPVRSCHVQCVSAAPGSLWLLTADGDVHVRQGMEQSRLGTGWVRLDLTQIDDCRLTHLAVGAQSVWACDAVGRILVSLGPTVARRCLGALQPAWVTVDSPPRVRFVQVTVGPGDTPVWAVDSCGVLWRRHGVCQQLLAGTEWQSTADMSAGQLTMSTARLWARSQSGAMHLRLADGQWCRVPGSACHVSASVSGELWIVHGNKIYTLQELTLAPGRALTPQVQRGDLPDWELVTC